MARARWVPAYVGIGSNLADPLAQVRSACRALALLPATRLMAISRLYRNPPLGGVPQPDFVNGVVALLTGLEALPLLDGLRAIEQAHGRQRTTHWGPRVLDLDLLLYGDLESSEPGLTLPHPGIRQRNFVLWPLLELAPGLSLPGVGSVRRLAEAVGTAGLEPVG